MPQRMANMTNRTLSGLFWTSLATGANVVLLLLVVMVLARLLSPADFGLAAAALIVIGFSAIFSECGVGPAVVQRSELRTAHLGSGFTLSLCLGLMIGGLTWLAAPQAAAFFQLEGLDPILRVLAVLFPLQALGVVADSLLQRELRFRALAIVDVITLAFGYGGVGISLAVLGFGAWALVGAYLTQMLLRTALLLCLRPHPIFPLLERRACAELLRFGGGFTAGRISNYFAGQAENLVIGRYLGAVALGVYGRAYQLMAAPAVLLGNVLDRVLFPTMVHVQKDPCRLAQAYRRASAFVALIILPLSAVVVALAPEAVHLVLGKEWDAVIVPLQILGLGMLFRTGCKTSDSLVRATGAVYRRTWRQTAYALLVLIGAIIGQSAGVEGVALAVLATLAFNFFLMAHLALRLAEMSWATFAVAHLPGLALAGLMGLPVALAATALRAWGAGPMTVVLLSLAVLLPILLVVVSLPGIFLGRDGQWMVKKLISLARELLARAPAGELSPSPSAGLVLATLKERLADTGIRYCRWKSHLDMQRVLSGAGDLDLLVHPDDADRFLRLAGELGFQRVVPMFSAPSAQEAHLYALDAETTALLHVHVNFRLLSADTGFAPSLEDLVLRHCAPDASAGVLENMPVVRPDIELLVFLLRAMEQYGRPREWARLALTGARFQAKLQALRMASPSDPWHSTLKSDMPPEAGSGLSDFLTALLKPVSWFRRVYLARSLRGKLATRGKIAAEEGNRLPAAGRVGRWRRLWHVRGNPKTFVGGGGVIAFVGPDASGKSTMVAQSASWLGQVFAVRVAHLGKPPSTWLSWIPNSAGRYLGRLAPRLRPSRQRSTSDAGKPSRRGLLYRLNAVLLAWDRRALALRLARQAERGWLMLCDRYPTAWQGAPDSARLSAPEAEPGLSRLHAWLARMERRLYRDIPDPAIVVRLSAPLALALDRNRQREKIGKEGDDFIAQRHGDFFMPSFGDAQVLVLDTSLSRSASIAALRRQLWQALCQPARSVRTDSSAPPPLQLAAVQRISQSPQPARNLVVEFIGTTGVGKSTLIRSLVGPLRERGLRVALAEDVLLARFGLACPRLPWLQSGLVFALSLRPFGRYFLTRPGSQLARMAFSTILRGAANPWIVGNLFRNFIKRIGAHFLLESLRDELCDHDIVIWDEGAVHAAHNLFVHTGAEPRPEEIQQFGRMVPKPDVLVWVTAPTDQLARVLLQRGHSRVRATPQAAQTFAQRAQTTFELLARVEELRARVVRIDNTRLDEQQPETAVEVQAGAVGTLLAEQLRQIQASSREGASLCLTA